MRDTKLIIMHYFFYSAALAAQQTCVPLSTDGIESAAVPMVMMSREGQAVFYNIVARDAAHGTPWNDAQLVAHGDGFKIARFRDGTLTLDGEQAREKITADEARFLAAMANTRTR